METRHTHVLYSKNNRYRAGIMGCQLVTALLAHWTMRCCFKRHPTNHPAPPPLSHLWQIDCCFCHALFSIIGKCDVWEAPRRDGTDFRSSLCQILLPKDVDRT